MDKFYQVQQLGGNGYWRGIGYFQTKKSAELYVEKFNTKVEVYPVKVVELDFLDPDCDM